MAVIEQGDAAEMKTGSLLDPLSEDFVIRSFEDAVAWFRAQNPNMATNRPQDLDWQAIKAEGRRY